MERPQPPATQDLTHKLLFMNPTHRLSASPKSSHDTHIDALQNQIDILQENLESSQHRLRLFERTSQIARVGGWEWDIQNGRRYWTTETCRILEVDSLETPTLNQAGWFEFYPEESRPLIEAAVRNAVENHIPFDLELPMITAKGRRIWVRDEGSVVTENGKAVMLHGAIQDITQRKIAETALAESESRTKLLVQAANVGLWDWDLQTNEAYYSPEWKKLLGYEDTDIKNQFDEWSSRLHPCDLQPTLDAVRAFHEGTSDTYGIEFRMRHRDGSWRWIFAQADLQRDSQNRPLRMMGCHIDITARKEAEEALRKSEERINFALDATQDGLWDWNIETGDVYFSPQWARLLGYPPEKVLPRVEFFFYLLHPEDVPNVKQLLDDHLAGRIPVKQGEVRLKMHSGEYRWFLDRGKVVVRDEEGKPLRMVGTITDITDRKHAQTALAEAKSTAESALRETEALRRTLAEHAIVSVADSDGKISSVNDRFCELSGFDREEILGQDFSLLDSGEQSPEFWREMRSVIQTGIAWKGEICNRSKNGKRYWVDSIIAPFKGQDGRIEKYVGIHHDITDRKQAEAQLVQAQKLESMGRLAGGVAHDFNNMLSVILGHSEIALSRIDASQPLAHHLQEVQRAAQRSADLTRQLLAFACKQIITPRAIQLNAAISSVMKMLSRLLGEDIQIECQPGQDLWLVQMDPSQIDQILTNLCVNARDAISHFGKITISTENIIVDEVLCASNVDAVPGQYVKLSVADTGAGMNKTTLAQIFEPFFTTKPIGVGTGLGLATVYGVVRQNHGFIQVSSEPGQGSTFEIFLPRFTGNPETFPKIASGISRTSNSETILVVEDEPALLHMTSTLLESMGYRVLVAATPREAKCLASDVSNNIQILLTDVVMPEMNGRDLANELMTSNPRLKRVFMSGYTSDFIADRGVLDDGVHFIQKPFSSQTLASKIREALERDL